MKMLVKYELLKILRKKSTFIIMLVSLLITAFLFGLPVLQFQTYNQDGVIEGFEGIAYEKEQYQDLSVELTDKYVVEVIKEVQALFENPENVGYDGDERFLINDAYWNGVAPRENMLNTIASVYAQPGQSVGYNYLADLDLSENLSFSEAREKKIETLLNTPSRELSDEQKAYWNDMNNNVDTTFQYGYHEGWETIMTAFELLMFAILSICIVIAPVFSGEYQAGTDAVILSAKYGKTKLSSAKIIASVLFGLIAFTIHIIVAFGIPLAAFGFDGWNLPLQLLGMTIPYPFTIIEAAFINLGVICLILLAMIGLTLLLSSKMKSPYLVLVVLVPILFVPMFFSPNGTMGIYNLTLLLLPYRAAIPEIGKYITYQFGSLVMDTFTIRAILYAVLVFIMLPFAKLGFKKHQVS